MKSIITMTVLFLLLIVAGCNELDKSKAEIVEDILDLVPLGSDMGDVISILQQNGHEIAWVNYENGFNDHGLRPPEIIGKKSIRAELGEYREVVFFKTSVTAFFAFDESDNLIDVKVYKNTDAP